MATHESFTYWLLNTVFYGRDCYIAVGEEEDEGGVGGDVSQMLTGPFFDLDEAKMALATAFYNHHARRSSLPPRFDGDDIRVDFGELLEVDEDERLVACFGCYFVVVFNEGTTSEYCIVFGPGNQICSDGLLSKEEALVVAKSLMLADEPTVLDGPEPSPSP